MKVAPTKNLHFNPLYFFSNLLVFRFPLFFFFFLNNQIFIFEINESITAETYICLHVTICTLGSHCTRTAQSLRGGCSRRVHKIV